MSIKARLGSASLHLFEAFDDLLPVSARVRQRRQGLEFARAVQGYQLSMAIGAACELGLFEALREPQSTADLAASLALSEPAARVLLDALEASGLVETGGERWELSAVGRRHFLRDRWGTGRGLVDFLLGSWTKWRDLPQALRSNQGHPDLRVYNPANPLMAEYVRLITSMLAGPSRDLVRRLDLSGVRRMICGTVGVSFAAAVSAAYPEVEVTISCLPLLIKELPAAVKEFGLKEPAEVIENSGDAEEDQWGSNESYDLVFLARKFAYCGPEHGIEYLKKSHRVIPPGGYVVLWEPVADTYEAAPWMGASLALVDAMLGEPHPLYRKAELLGFARQAGYEPVTACDVAGGSMSFIVAQRP